MLLNVIGISSSLVGSIVLAFSISSLVKAIMSAFWIIDKSLGQIADVINNPNTKGVIGQNLPEHIRNADKSKYWTVLGVIFLVLGFVLQVVASFSMM